MQSDLVEESKKREASIASSTDEAEETLVAAAKSGDVQAFETLVKRHQPRILALALRYTRVQQDAEDVAQQTFQKAFVYLHKFQGKSSFSTWLTRIGINEALMLLRRGRTLRVVPLEDSINSEGTTPALEIADEDPDPEASYLQREQATILAAALGRLRPGTRAAIELRELAELSAQETARSMGLSVSAVKARLFHGRRKLREVMGRYMRSPRMSGTGILAVAGNANRV